MLLLRKNSVCCEPLLQPIHEMVRASSLIHKTMRARLEYMEFGRSLSLTISRKEIERPITSESIVRSHGEEQRRGGARRFFNFPGAVDISQHRRLDFLEAPRSRSKG